MTVTIVLPGHTLAHKLTNVASARTEGAMYVVIAQDGKRLLFPTCNFIYAEEEDAL